MDKTPVVLINTNETKPPIAPLALDYIAGALRAGRHPVTVVDLNFAENVDQALDRSLGGAQPRLVGMTFRNSDDCFWPSCRSFVPRLVELVAAVRRRTDAPIVLGGAGFSVFPQALLWATGCDWGVRGDGEPALLRLLEAMEQGSGWETVPGLVWRASGSGEVRIFCNPAEPGQMVRLTPSRDAVDNPRYFAEGGQIGVETKRGCPGECIYCADPLIKGTQARCRPPSDVADEIESLLRQGIDVLHLCDGEFNVPRQHALDVSLELIRRCLGTRVQWYTYASITPFDDELAGAMRSAGCVGINFGADSASDPVLASYGRPYRKVDVAAAIRLCKRHGLRVMIDLLLGGPGETESTLRETMDFLKTAGPDCVGSALGMRIYPGTRVAAQVLQSGPLDANPNLRRMKTLHHSPRILEAHRTSHGLLLPVFYVSRSLGERPAQLVRDIIAGDTRFFEPTDEQSLANYNYDNNQPLVDAIRNGARGAYWDILRQMRGGDRACPGL